MSRKASATSVGHGERKPVAFILGAGPRIGHALLRHFTSAGYAVALGSRNPDRSVTTKYNGLSLSVDVANARSVGEAFDDCKNELGVPCVVVYNAAALSFDPQDPFGGNAVDSDVFARDLSINLTGAFTALRCAVQGFNTLPTGSDVPKVFIATGNVVPFMPAFPMGVTLGPGKTGLAYLIDTGNNTPDYKNKGFRFYFASQVTKDGGPVPYEDVDAEAHGSIYLGLVNEDLEGVQDGKWDVRFVNGDKIVN